MVIIDEYSRFPEVEIMSTISAKTIISRLDTVFSRQGIPQIIKSDNGPPFKSKKIGDFAEQFCIQHKRITPLWPEANGEAERFMKTLNKHVRSSVADNKNWKSELPQFSRQYRATPHSSTGISPFEILTGRQMNIGLPQLHQNTSSALIHPHMTQNDHISKSKMKMYTDTKQHNKPSDLQVGDHVLVKQPKTDKQAFYHHQEKRNHVHCPTRLSTNCQKFITLQTSAQLSDCL